MEAKQVIVMRKMTKGCRTGKYCAQAAHASLGAVLSASDHINETETQLLVIPLSNPYVRDWLIGRFKKVVVYVDTDEELIALYDEAKKNEVLCALIRDAGLTEFDGVPTLTAVGIGPDAEEKINKITGHLPLF